MGHTFLTRKRVVEINYRKGKSRDYINLRIRVYQNVLTFLKFSNQKNPNIDLILNIKKAFYNEGYVLFSLKEVTMEIKIVLA